MKSTVTDKDGLLKLEHQLCFALYSTSRTITKYYSRLLADMGVTYPQYLALIVLWKRDGLLIQEIAKSLELEGATTTPLIQRMEKLELVVRKRSEKDERHVQVFLTEKGKSLYEQAASIPHELGCAMGIDADAAARIIDDLENIKKSVQRSSNSAGR